MTAVCPGEVLNVLVAFVQTALRAAEVRSGNCAGGRMDRTRNVGLVRSAGQRTNKGKPCFVYQVGGQRRNDSRIDGAHVRHVGSEIVRSDVIARLHDQVILEDAVDVKTCREGVLW